MRHRIKLSILMWAGIFKISLYLKRVDDINKSVKIQSQEARNKDLMTLKFASIKKQAREVRVGTQAASRYYKSMSGTGYMEPQFMDNKK